MENEKADELIKQNLLSIAESMIIETADETYNKYIDLIHKIENEEYYISNDVTAEVYVSFAYFLFQVSEFEHCFKMLIRSQSYKLLDDEIVSLLFEAFVKPNINEFRRNYNVNIEFLNTQKYLDAGTTIGFEELPFWLLPTEVKYDYFIFDKKERRLLDKISLFKYNTRQPLPTGEALADYLLMADWNCNEVLSYTNAIRRLEKKTYVIINDLGNFLSCLQGRILNETVISNVLITNNIESMYNYLMNSDETLPRNVINLMGEVSYLNSIIEKVHKHRMKEENRKGDNILLSICIPSYNRGKRALQNIKYLLQLPYDEEIEVIISNNGTQNETKDYYDEVQKIDDARLNYFKFEENQGFAVNISKVCELARGNFLLLLSDEDIVDFNILDKVMSILNKSEHLAILRTSSNSQSKPPVKKADPGRDSLLTFMLTSNYMSGIILNNKLLKESKGIEYVLNNLENQVCYLYPHMFWELLLCQYGHVEGTNLILINEGEAEKTEASEVKLDEVIIPYYASVEGRLEQHKGFTEIFKELDICINDNNLLRNMYLTLCWKTLFLINLSLNVFYRKTNNNLHELLKRGYDYCINEDFYKRNINPDQSIYLNDLLIITKNYENMKNGLQ